MIIQLHVAHLFRHTIKRWNLFKNRISWLFANVWLVFNSKWTIWDRMWNSSSLLSNMDYNYIDFLFFIFFICINWLEQYRFTSDTAWYNHNKSQCPGIELKAVIVHKEIQPQLLIHCICVFHRFKYFLYRATSIMTDLEILHRNKWK